MSTGTCLSKGMAPIPLQHSIMAGIGGFAVQACGDNHVVRQILVDGVDVALQHGGRRRLSPAGIAFAVAHFLELSFPVRVRF